MNTGTVIMRALRPMTFVVLGLGSLCAQGIDSTLVGTVTDPSGSSVAGAIVTATRGETGIEYQATTDRAGQYRVDHLPIGIYSVQAVAPNFSPNTTTNVALQLNRTASVDFSLQLATQATSLQVVAAPAPLDSASSQLQTTFDTRLLINAPAATTGSGFVNLSLLAAGVASSGGLGQGTGPSVAGQRPTGNRFFVEGADNNSYFVTGPLGSVVVSNEAIAEFSLLQNHFNSEYGGATGGIFNTVLKSGGNRVHGSLYEYFKNRNLMALDALYARQGATQPPRYDDNRLGATIGGPILKDKLFYFGSFEYNPIGYAVAPGPVVSAPTAEGFQALANLPGISRTNFDVLRQQTPAAARQNSTVSVLNTRIPVGPLSIVAPVYYNNYRAAGSADWNVSHRDQVRGRYIYGRSMGIDPSGVTLPQFFADIPNNTHLISLSEYHSFSPAMQNELRLAYTRNDNRRTAGNPVFPGLDTFPAIAFEDLGLQLGASPNVPNGQIQGSLQLTDNITRTMGRHTVKAGYDFRDIILATSFVSNPRGFYRYRTLDQYLRDLTPNSSGTRFLGTTGPLVNGMPGGFLQNAAYVQDDFRIRSNLTLNLGVRYEFVTVPVMSRAQQFSSIADVPGVITFREPQPRKTDWSPRLGFAYSPGRSGVWAIRGGFSRSFDMPYANLAANTAPLFYGTSVGVNINSNTPGFLAGGGLNGASNALSTPAAARAATSGYTPDQMRPYALNYTLSVQRLLGKDYTIEARYIGSRGVHLLVQQQMNRVSPVTASRNIPTFLTKPAPSELAALTLTPSALQAAPSNMWAVYGFTNSASITALEPRGNSQYHGLALQITKRYSQNFSYLAAYTWSHLMDDSTATANTTLLTPRRPQDFQNLRGEWADSILDRRHRFTIAPVIDITPFSRRGWALKNLAGNWSLTPVYTFESPQYATVQSGIDSNFNNDSATDRAIVNPNGAPNVGSGVTGYDRNGNISTSSNAIVAYVANNPNARYIVAGAGAFANGGRNTFPLGRINNIDISVRKAFSLSETKQLEFGAQFFNLLNHPQFVPGFTNDAALAKNSDRRFLIPNNPLFGQYQQVFSSNSRFIQLVARLVF